MSEQECTPILDPAGIDQLRTALHNADYTAEGIQQRLGPDATAAVTRRDVRAALRATAGGDPLDTLIRLFVCDVTEPEAAVAAALAPLPLPVARAAGLVVPVGDGLHRGVDLEPYGPQWWLMADVPARPGQPTPTDHVLGVGGAATTLVNATIRRPVGTALDIGTGSGVQALHLSTHAEAVTATDISPRALRFAATNAALNDVQWQLHRGDLAAPVAGDRFDLVVSNPPFVIGPGAASHTYRDSGRPGDALGAELAALAPTLLTEGGTMQYLANWLHLPGQDWRERVAGWFAGTGCDAWVIQREVTDPLSYVRLWLDDAGQQADPGLAAQWLDWFDQQQVAGVGFGVVTIRYRGSAEAVIRAEELRQQVEQPLGAQIEGWFGRQDWLERRDGDALLEGRYVAADGITLQQEASIGDDGWQVDRQLLAMSQGLRWVQEADPLAVALVGGANGQVRLRDQLTLLASAYEATEGELAQVAVPLVAHLVERGILLPAPEGDAADQ